MNKYGQRHCPPRKKRKRQCGSKRLGLVMIGLGIITVLAIFLPMKYWVMLLAAALVVFGIILIKSH